MKKRVWILIFVMIIILIAGFAVRAMAQDGEKEIKSKLYDLLLERAKVQQEATARIKNLEELINKEQLELEKQKGNKK